MKILWLCKWFGNYRIPVYEHLNKLSGGNFYMAYNKEAVSELVHKKMEQTLGENAIGLEKEKHLIIGNKDSDMANGYIDFAWQPGLLKAIKNVNPDIIISDGFYQWTYAAILKSFRRKLCIFYERTAFVERNAPGWRKTYRKIMGKFADGFLINGSLTREYLAELGFSNRPMVEGCMVADCEGLSMAVNNCEENEITALAESIGITKGKGLVFLFVGQLVQRKGIKELLSVWGRHVKEFPDDSIIVAGQGVMESELKEKFSKVPGIKFVGQINYDAIHRYYALADVSVMPTLEDNWSLVVPEAMACGKPVATTPYNGCHVELIEEGCNGHLFDPLSEQSILDMLKAFHYDNLESLGRRSQEIIKNYTPSEAANNIYNLCQKLTSKGAM